MGLNMVQSDCLDDVSGQIRTLDLIVMWGFPMVDYLGIRLSRSTVSLSKFEELIYHVSCFLKKGGSFDFPNELLIFHYDHYYFLTGSTTAFGNSPGHQSPSSYNSLKCMPHSILGPVEIIQVEVFPIPPNLSKP